MPARLALVLGHGAGGGVAAPDLVVVTETALAAGVTVALVEQPYRVAGRRSPSPAPRLDEAWIAVVEQLAAGPLAGLPLLVGGRSIQLVINYDRHCPHVLSWHTSQGEGARSAMRVCIVGASGKLGQYIVQHALDRDYEVVGVCREESVGKLRRVQRTHHARSGSDR